MSTIDEKIVKLSMDSSNFQKGSASAAASMQSLSKNLQTVAGNTSLDQLGNSADQAQSKFSILAGAASVALGNIGTQAINAGLNVIKGFVNPIAEGFASAGQRTQALLTLQTALGNSAAATSKISAALNDVDTYANKTIYSVQGMTSNLAGMVNAGINIDTATAAIKGMGNVAAAAGVDTNLFGMEMQTAVVQAEQMGVMQYQNWKQLQQAGMATKQLTDALTAQASKSEQAKIKTQGFDASLKDNWLTMDVFNKVLKNFSVDKTLEDAATQAHTFQQAMDAASESSVYAWQQVWTTLLGSEEDQTKLWTGLENVMTDIESGPATAILDVTKDFVKLGGATAILKTISNLWTALGNVVKPIKDAFKEIFPNTLGATLANLAKGMQNFTAKLIISKPIMTDLKNIFAGLFSVVKLVVDVVQFVGNVFGSLVSHVMAIIAPTKSVNTSFLELVGNLAKHITNFQKWVEASGAFKRAMDAVNQAFDSVVAKIKPFVQIFSTALTSFIESFSKLAGGSKDVKSFEDVWKNFQKTLTDALTAIGKAFGIPNDAIDKLKKKLQSLDFGAVGDKFAAFTKTVKSSSDSLANSAKSTGSNISAWATATTNGFHPILGLQKALKEFGNWIDQFFSNLSSSFAKGAASAGGAGKAGGSFLGTLIGDLGNALKDGVHRIAPYISNFFNTVFGYFMNSAGQIDWSKVFNILKLALQSGILKNLMQFAGNVKEAAGSFSELAENLSKGAAGIASFAKLGTTLNSTIGKFGKAANTQAIGAVIKSIALLVAALAALSLIPSNKIMTGLAGMAGVMAIVIASFAAFSKISKGSKTEMAAIAGAMTAIGLSVSLLVPALLALSLIPTNKLMSGLLGLAAVMAIFILSLTALAKVAKGSGVSLVLAATSMLIMAAAMDILLPALTAFSLIPADKMGNGILALTAAILAMAAGIAALSLMGPMVLVAAAAFLIMSAAVVVLAVGLTGLIGALALANKVGMDKLVTGAEALSVALVILGSGLLLASPGMLAFSIAALAMGAALMMAGAGIKLIAIGIGGIALAFSALLGVILAFNAAGDRATNGAKILGSALLIVGASILAFSALMLVAAPGLLVFGAALLVAGAGAAVFGAGILMAGAGMALLGVGITVIAAGFSKMPVSTWLGVAAALTLIGVAALVAAPGLLLISVAAVALAAAFAIVSVATIVLGAGLLIVSGALAIISTLGPGLTASAVAMTIMSVAFAVLSVALAAFTIVATVALIPLGLFSVVLGVFALALGATGVALKVFSAGLLAAYVVVQMVVGAMKGNFSGLQATLGGIWNGITGAVSRAFNGIKDMIGNALNTVKNVVGNITSAIVNFAQGLWGHISSFFQAIPGHIGDAFKEIGNVGKNLVQGLWNGISNAAGWVMDKIKGFGSSILNGIKGFFGIHSPSAVMRDQVGVYIAQGVGIGISKATSDVVKQSNNFGKAVSNALVNSTDISGMNLNPTIRPVMDLTDITAGANKINTMFSGSQALGVNASINASVNGGSNGLGVAGKNVTYVQNNYSPKSLDAITIYRQTHNSLVANV